jgi:hypothetical protein
MPCIEASLSRNFREKVAAVGGVSDWNFGAVGLATGGFAYPYILFFKFYKKK